MSAADRRRVWNTPRIGKYKMLTRRQALKSLAVGGVLAAGIPLAGCTVKVTNDSGGGSTEMRTLDKIIESGVLRIAVITDLQPYSYTDEMGVYQGFDVELGRRIAQDMSVGIEFVNVDVASRIMFLQNNKADIILSCFSVTEDRKQKIDFAEAYMNVPTGILSHTGHVATSADDFGTRPIITTVGSATELKLMQLAPNAKLEKYDSYTSARMAFEKNEEALWAGDTTDLVAYVRANEGKCELGIDEFGEAWPVAPAIAKGNTTLLDWLNEEMYALGSENFFHKDYDATLLNTYGDDYREVFIIEPGQ